MGDYNINTLNEMQESEILKQKFSNIFSSHYYHKLIHLPTREREKILYTFRQHLHEHSQLL